MSQGPAYDALETARSFVARAPMFMSLLDLEGRVIEVSPLVAEAHLKPAGVPREAILGQRVGDMFPREAEAMADALARLIAGEGMVESERCVQTPGGDSASLRSQMSYWRDDEGRPVAVLCMHHDVGPEMRARAALAESEEQLRAIIENLPLQISLMEVESGQVSLMNRRMSENFAVYSGARPGADYRQTLDPARRAYVDRLIADAESGLTPQTEIAFEHGPCAGGVFNLRYVVFRDSRGRSQLLCVGEDVTELRRSAQALERAAAEADAANRAKSDFLANMSHEIRTPLNGVMGVAGALAQTALTPAQHEMVVLVETSAKTLEALLSDILDLARIEAGKMELREEPFDLAVSVNACGALFDAAAQGKGLDLTVDIAPGALGAYMGDAARLRQILSNLLGNAVKFTREGGVHLTVGARRDETTSVLTFAVRDTGIGFDAETKARLFSRFEQADGSITRRFGGSGLGLAISSSLAEAMGGRLEADATPGEGAVFTLTLELPRCASAFDYWVEVDEAELPPDPLHGLRVLLAEDHPVNRRVVELILGASGVDLTCVENGQEAVEAFQAQPFDLILMDMQMPVMDGLTAIREIRRIEAASGASPMQILVLTANAMPEHIRASAEAGADGHLSKPIEAQSLLKRMTEVAEGLQERTTPTVQALAS